MDTMFYEAQRQASPEQGGTDLVGTAADGPPIRTHTHGPCSPPPPSPGCLSCLQGRFSFYMTCSGEEATVIGSAAALNNNDMVGT